MKLGMEVGLSPGHIVLDGDTAPHPKGTQPHPQFSSHVYCSQTAEMGDRLATIDIGRKEGVVPLWERGSWITTQHDVGWAEAYLSTKWHLDPLSRLVTTNMGRKLGGGYCAHLRGSWVPT